MPGRSGVTPPLPLTHKPAGTLEEYSVSLQPPAPQDYWYSCILLNTYSICCPYSYVGDLASPKLGSSFLLPPGNGPGTQGISTGPLFGQCLSSCKLLKNTSKCSPQPQKGMCAGIPRSATLCEVCIQKASKGSMESVLWCCLLFFVTIGIGPLVTGAPFEGNCSKSNLNITGGKFFLSNEYNEDSILRYRCDPGYFPYPVKTRQCSRGKWDPAPIIKKPSLCKKVTCPNPNVLTNGVVEPYKPQYYVNDTTTYRCHSDYTFRGSSQRVCQINGKWSGNTPICSRDSDHCHDPGTPPGASRTGHIFNIDDKVTYRCDNKLKLLGSKVRVCLDGGLWSGREPECYADFTYDTPAEVAEAFGNTLKTTLTTHEEKGQKGKKITLDQKGKLNIYIALDASDSIDEEKFDEAKSIIGKLIDKISFFEVSPNYEIIVFATEVSRIVSLADYQREDERKLHKILKTLNDYKYDDKGQKTGTNIAKAFETILDSMKFEEVNKKEAFNEIRHVIIMFTDGIYNMGGNPAHKVMEIKELVYKGDETKRNEHLDESSSVGLCGLYRDYDDESDDTRRRKYPWLIQISVTREDGKTSNCLGSLVTPSFILTAAHCFKFDDVPESIRLDTPAGRSSLSAKGFMLHPDYKPKSKVTEGISENYQYDVALIELDKGVETDTSLRPICIPCTKETSGALRLFGGDVTCTQHKKQLLNKDLVDAFFMSAKRKNDDFPKEEVQIKQGHKIDACIDDTKAQLNITGEKARQLLTGHFLCTGGTEINTVDKVSCKGDSGGATFLQQDFRAFQVGVVSWGLKDPCSDQYINEVLDNTRDFHVDLFNPKVQEFLKLYLGDGTRGAPLTFLER
ncbi:hypothetical protein NFI96_001662 [Prochilodus magdalenae]|nr:hypothetical protein NFI96_001662 [Prochilodus magdalenae]